MKLLDIESGKVITTFGELLTASVADSFKAVKVSLDGRRIIAASDDKLYVWDRDTGKELLSVGKRFDGWARFAITPDGEQLAFEGKVEIVGEPGTSESRIRIFSLKTGEEWSIRLPRGYMSGYWGDIAFSPNGRYLLFPIETGILAVDAKTGQKVTTLHGHTNRITCFGFSPDGRYLVTGSADRTVKLWDLVGLGLHRPE